MKKKASNNGRWVMAAGGVLLAFERSTISRSSTSEHEQTGPWKKCDGWNGWGPWKWKHAATTLEAMVTQRN